MKKYNSVAVVGSQWGDEGKGKITNYLAQEAKIVVRWAGGNNAGHSIKIGDVRYALHLLPSGILDPAVMNVIGNGVVLDPMGMELELETLRQKGIKDFQLKVSDRAHVVFPYHVLMDGLQEAFRSARKIGTTKRGIGPAYMDKADRIGIRVIDLFDDELLKNLIKDNVYFKNIIVDHLEKDGYDISVEFENALIKVKLKSEEKYELLRATLNSDNRIDEQKIYDLAVKYRELLRPYVDDTSVYVYNELEKGTKVLFEGAQGVLLSLDHGTYPFVTSSEPGSSAIPVGVGLPAWAVNKSLGIVKVYSTRIGTGGFPTEFEDETAKQIRTAGNEFGTTTGRPRRIGWFDAVLVRHAVRVSGLTHIAITLLDVLSGVGDLKIAINYDLNGNVIENLPAGENDFNNVKPIYIEVPGWTEDITNVKTFDELPKATQNYLLKIEEVTGVKIAQFSVGPERNKTIDLIKMFD